ncbi:MAG: KH domain-containing protein [Candidatus Methanomethylicaceae archaeon]|jgi:ribosomal RNA assembly protein
MDEKNMSQIFLKIPVERAGVLIGDKGITKFELEKGTGATITVDGKLGDVIIEAPSGGCDPSGILKARDLVNAIGRGFSPDKAFRLFDDNQIIEVIDLKEIVGDSRNTLVRIKGRIIGENGKTRRLIESLAGVWVSVYGHTVALIGDYEEMRVAKEAIELLLKGCQHGTVYRYLNKEHLELKKRKLLLWERMPELKETKEEKK